MSPRRLRLGRALDALPDLEELQPLRQALLDTSREEVEGTWEPPERHVTLDRRQTRLGPLKEQIPELAEQVRARLERTLGHTVAALAALDRGDPAQAAGELIAAGEIEEAA